MEMVISVTEVKPGERIARHFHHGEEAVYVLEGATVETPDGKQIPFQPGTASINVRNVAHAGIKVVATRR